MLSYKHIFHMVLKEIVVVTRYAQVETHLNTGKKKKKKKKPGKKTEVWKTSTKYV